MRMTLPCSIALLLFACGAHHRDAVPTPASADPDLDTARAYDMAIADYIQAMDRADAPIPDTLYIGRHPDFPGIQLSRTMGTRTILLIAPAEGEALRDDGRFAYLNIFATYTPGQVEFLVVRFERGLRHHPDGRDDRHLYYGVGAGGRELSLQKVMK